MSQQQVEADVRALAILETLDRVLAGGANPDDVEALAEELGVARWMRKNDSKHTANGLKNEAP